MVVSSGYVQLLLADARLPTGAHTQSGGLEPALRHGLARGEIPAFLSARLQTVTETEAAAAVVARHRRLAGPTDGLADVDDAWRARTPSDAARTASDLLGRGYRRLAERIWSLGLDPARTYGRPVVLGATAAAAGLGAAELVRVVGYDDVQTVLSAALKLEPFDPAQATAWALAAGDEVEALVARVADLTEPDTIPARSAPALELWLQWHAHEERRLYRA
ncbi:MAG: urease accessory protein UreF [Propionibacteriaceae bacterium]